MPGPIIPPATSDPIDPGAVTGSAEATPAAIAGMTGPGSGTPGNPGATTPAGTSSAGNPGVPTAPGTNDPSAPGSFTAPGESAPGSIAPLIPGGEASPGEVSSLPPNAPQPPSTTPSDAVRYSVQVLTPPQKAQARTNIGAETVIRNQADGPPWAELLIIGLLDDPMFVEMDLSGYLRPWSDAADLRWGSTVDNGDGGRIYPYIEILNATAVPDSREWRIMLYPNVAEAIVVAIAMAPSGTELPHECAWTPTVAFPDLNLVVVIPEWEAVPGEEGKRSIWIEPFGRNKEFVYLDGRWEDLPTRLPVAVDVRYAEEKSTELSNDDRLGLWNSATRKLASVTLGSLWTWIKTKLNSALTIAGPKTWSGPAIFTNSSRISMPSVTGTPAATDAMKREDVDDTELWAVGRLVRMTTTNGIGAATGNASSLNVHGQLQLYSGTNAGSGVGHYVWRPIWTVAGGTNGYRTASEPCGFAFRGLAQFGTGATNKERIWFAFHTSAASVSLADSAEPVSHTAIGMEFWISGTTRKVRLFYRKDNSTGTVYSSTYDLTYGSDADIDSYYFRSDGVNIYLYYLPSHATNRRISQSPVIAWMNAIINAPARSYLFLCASSVQISASPTSGGSFIIQSLVINPP